MLKVDSCKERRCGGFQLKGKMFQKMWEGRFKLQTVLELSALRFNTCLRRWLCLHSSDFFIQLWVGILFGRDFAKGISVVKQKQNRSRLMPSCWLCWFKWMLGPSCIFFFLIMIYWIWRAAVLCVLCVLVMAVAPGTCACFSYAGIQTVDAFFLMFISAWGSHCMLSDLRVSFANFLTWILKCI